MVIKNLMRKLFSVDVNGSTRVVIYILGIRFRFIKPEFKNKINEYNAMECKITDIPKATGVLRKFQLASIKLLLMVDKICKENNIQYWSDYGNLLGAVRHNGFIPWDDDCDIGMLRDDYLRFIDLISNNPEKYPDIYLVYDNNGKNRCFVKVKCKQFDGIAMDVFPYDLYYKKTTDEEKEVLTQKIRKITHSRWNALFKPFYIFSHTLMSKRLAKLTYKLINEGHSVNKENKPSVFPAIDYPQRNLNLVYDYEDLFPLKTLDFEGLEIIVPNNPHKVLTQEYGDYMVIPEDCYPRHIFYGNVDTTILDNFIEDMLDKVQF